MTSKHQSLPLGYLMLAGSVSLAINLMMLALPIYSLQVFDRVLSSRSEDTLWVLTAAVVVVMLALSVLEGLRAQIMNRLANRLALAMEPVAFEQTMTSAAGGRDRSLAALRDVSVLRGFIAGPQGLAPLIDAPLIPIYLAVVYLIHPILGNVMLVGIILLLVLAIASERLAAARNHQAADAAQLAQNGLADLALGADALAALGMRRAAFQRWQSNAHHPALAGASSVVAITARLNSIGKAARLLLNVAVTGFGAYLVIHDQITVGAMLAANIISARGLAPLEVLIGAGKQMVAARSAYRKLAAAAVALDVAERMRLPRPSGRVEVEGLTFLPKGHYKAVVDGVSFEVAAGEFVGLIGPSAAGKTTLARLMSGVLRPSSGSVRMDGAEVSTWHEEDLGPAIGYLPQDVQLFDGSVKENICRFAGGDEAAIVEAARLAGAHDMIVRLAQGYDTRIGYGGSLLSAGQRQRIGLARAVFGDPAVVLLDEPNSNLDAVGEQALANCMEVLKRRGVTLIVISHRPSLLALADKVAVIVAGRLQQFGPRDQVVTRVAPRPISVA